MDGEHEAGVAIAWHAGPRDELRGLFALAEDSPQRVEASLHEGHVLVASDDGQIVGCLQLVEGDANDAVQLKTAAVVEHRRGQGIGRALVARAIAESRAAGDRRLVVATAATDIGNLRFYQRLGFRMLRVERDAFTPTDGYPEDLTVDGIPLRDRVWLDLASVMQLRIARHTERLDELVRFYRDGLGLTEIGGFRGHDGYDGVFLAVPGTGAHLELTAGGEHGAPAPHPESLLVLYLGDDAAVRAAIARLRLDPVAPANPYWAQHGVTIEDPDGFRVVLVPERWGDQRVPLFCDSALAERIERLEADLVARGAEATRRRRADGEGFMTPIAGGVATFAEEGSPFNKVAGLGFGGVPCTAALDEVERAFAACGAPVQIELAHLADPAIGILLTERGYRLAGFENVLGLALEGELERVMPPGVEARPSGDDELEAWLEVVVEGVAHQDTQGVPAHEEFPRAIVESAERDFVAAGVTPYLALRDGVIAGGAGVRMAEGVAQLTGAATARAHRRRGVHTALLWARLADGAAAGCDVAVITTPPGSTAQQNAQRRSFDLLYTRAILEKRP